MRRQKLIDEFSVLYKYYSEQRNNFHLLKDMGKIRKSSKTKVQNLDYTLDAYKMKGKDKKKKKIKILLVLN